MREDNSRDISLTGPKHEFKGGQLATIFPKSQNNADHGEFNWPNSRIEG